MGASKPFGPEKDFPSRQPGEGKNILIFNRRGTFVHSELSNLSYALAGHTGFAPIDSPIFTTKITTPLLKVTTGAAVGNILISNAAGDLTYLAAGATTTILVGGGAAAPVWTTATGTGSPVRAGSPTFTTQITSPLIYGSAVADGDITIRGTSHATKTTSYVILQDTGGNVGIGIAPETKLHVENPAGGPPSATYATTVANAALHLSAVGVSIYNHLLMGVGSVAYSWIQSQHGNSSVQYLALNPLGGNVAVGFTAPLSALCINGGLHVGGESAAGDNNLLVDGTGEITGISTLTGYVKAIGGIHVGGTSDPGIDNILMDGYIRSSVTPYVSQTTGWNISQAGEGDFRYLFTDELHAKAFIADLEQALAGGQIICKSVSLLGAAFTAPAAGGAVTLTMKDLPSAENMAVFESGDYIRLRIFSRAAGSLTIADCWGIVTSYTDQTNKLQTWTFTRGSGANAGTMAQNTVVKVDSIVLDYGVTGNGFYEVNAIDGLYGVNSPYSQIVTWTTSPIAANQVCRVRLGNLKGLPWGVANEYGLYAGDGTGDANKYFRISNTAVEIHNVPIKMYDGAVNTVLLSSTTPSFAMGATLPTGYMVENGIWMGKDTVYKMRVGSVSAGALIKGFSWDGTNLSIIGSITIIDGSGYANISDKPTTLNAIEAGTGTKLGGIETGATVGATWGTNLTDIPGTLGAPAGTGLFLSATHMGYYTADAWKTFIKSDGTFAFAGDANNYVTWNGTTLAIKGNITATTGTIGGFTIGATTLIAGTTITRIELNTAVGIHLGATAFADAKFSVTRAGAIKAESGVIGGFTLSTTILLAGSAATRIELNTTAGIHLGATTFADAPFSATLAGVVKAISGTVGGCALAATSIGSTTFVSGPLGSGWNISNTGTAEFQNALIRGILRTTVFEKDTISAVNGLLLITKADVLATDMTAADASTLTITGESSFVNNEVIRIKDGVDDEWMLVTNAANAPTYVVTRDLAASYAANTNPIWKEGTAVVSMGVGTGTKTGYILIDSSSANSPYIDVYGRNSNTYTDTTLHARIGWLKGLTDADVGLATTDTWGIYSDNAYIKGVIVANTGYIGGASGWTIAAGSISSINAGNTTTMASGGTNAYIAGTTGAPQFKVTHAGAITATSGAIGGFTIGDTTLIAGATTTRIELNTAVGIHMGATVFADAPFSVTRAGALKATEITKISTTPISDGSNTQSVVLIGSALYETSRNDGLGRIMIHMKGYEGDYTQFRSTWIGNGKNSVMVEFDGDNNEIDFHSPVIARDTMAVGLTSINANAVLHVQSTTKGFLPPRMTNAQMNAITDVAGMIAYDATNNHLYVNTGAAWKQLDN